jgi:hypothetical protein
MSSLTPAQFGLVEHVTLSVTVEGGEVLLFMVPKPDAERLEALALRRGLSAEQIVAEWIRLNNERPLLSDEELRSHKPEGISGCCHGFRPLRKRNLDHLLAFLLSLVLLLADLYDYWQ